MFFKRWFYHLICLSLTTLFWCTEQYKCYENASFILSGQQTLSVLISINFEILKKSHFLRAQSKKSTPTTSNNSQQRLAGI
jgi:hypothetical protein